MTSLQKVIISVTSDLVSDQRVHKVALSLCQNGYDVTVFGRKKRNSQKLLSQPYQTKRCVLPFEKGLLFYLFYQLRLFIYLLSNKADIFLSNDLDTLLPNFLAAKILNRKLVYDSHEYYTGVPELLERPFKRAIWKKLENTILPKLIDFYSVNDSVADLYRNEYSVEVKVIRNLPYKLKSDFIKKYLPGELIPAKNSEKAVVLNLIYEVLKLEKRKIIIYQGAVNKDRGLEECIEAMAWVENALLLIIGDGDVLAALKQKTKNLELSEKVLFTGMIPFTFLPYFTCLATIGISIEKPTNVNYKLASPNKVVDYINANIPVIASKLTEIEKLLNYYNIGFLIDSHEPRYLAKILNNILNDKDQLVQWSLNCEKAAKELIWENEEKKLLQIFSHL
jgi:glycosyltransferase involved in cell wall biosynthesis